MDVLAIAILGCLCGCDNAEALEDWANKEKSWLEGFLTLAHGIPSQDVFLRVLSAIEPEKFREAFIHWSRVVLGLFGIPEQLAIDGQTHRGSRDRRQERNPVHMVHAFACESGLVLGQRATDTRSNEITAIPELLGLLDLRGALVSIDAMGCQAKIAHLINDRGGDYLLGLKGNQSNLHKETEALFQELAVQEMRTCDELDLPPTGVASDVDGGHGRIETRTATLCSLKGYEHWVPSAERWPDLKCLIAIHATREDAISGQISQETRYYISSRNLSAESAIRATRMHWLVENQLHWCLDMTFGQDSNRTRRGYASENLAVVRHFALNLVRQYKGDRYSVPRRRRLCDYNAKYRTRLLHLGGAAT